MNIGVQLHHLILLQYSFLSTAIVQPVLLVRHSLTLSDTVRQTGRQAGGPDSNKRALPTTFFSSI